MDKCVIILLVCPRQCYFIRSNENVCTEQICIETYSRYTQRITVIKCDKMSENIMMILRYKTNAIEIIITNMHKSTEKQPFF